MKENNLYLNHISDLTSEGLRIIDKNFNIVSCNKKYVQFNNQKSENLVGLKCYDCLCPDNCSFEECALTKILNGTESIETVIEKTKSKETKYFRINIRPLKNKKNEITGFIECFTDITSTKIAELRFEQSETQSRINEAQSKEFQIHSRISEAQLKRSKAHSRRSEAQLRESEAQLKNVNATRDDLFSRVAHDLRNPFTSILGFSELLIEDITLYGIAEIEEFVKNINSSAQNALTLLENMLNWAVTQTGRLVLQPEKLILLLLIKETLKISNAEAKLKNITLNYDQLDEIEIETDINAVKTILRNLISHAIKFTNLDGKINISTIYSQDEVEISVAVNSVRMNEEKCKNLFELPVNAFSYNPTDEKGTGLGLVVCKEFVEKLGGRIWAESKEVIGSDLKFTLPLRQPVFNKKETTFNQKYITLC